MRSVPVFLALVGLLGTLAACGTSVTPALDVDVIGTEGAPFETGVRLSVSGLLVRSATSEGLVALDEQGRVISALADRWIVTEDGLSYIFRLRDGLWLDGTAITSQTVKAALRQALGALDNTPLAQEFLPIEDVRAMAGRVIEIRLAAPMPDLLQLLAQPELALLHKGQGAGPMTLRREGPLAALAPIAPGRLGLPQPEGWDARVRDIRLHAVPAELAARRFRQGDVDLVLGGRFQDLAFAEAAAGLSRRTLKLDPVAGLFGLVVLQPTGALAERDLREALAMAIDRDSLAAALGLGGGWTPTTRIVANGSEGDLGTIGERWTDAPLARRQADAAARIARWQGRTDAVPLRLAVPAGPGGDQLYARLVTDFATIGVRVQRVAPDSPADLKLIDLVARYSRPSWYLNQLSCAARRGLCSAAADARLAEARLAQDPQRRAALLAEAEAELTSANVFIPLGEPVRWSLVRDSIAGFVANAAGFHPLAPLALHPE